MRKRRWRLGVAALLVSFGLTGCLSPLSNESAKVATQARAVTYVDGVTVNMSLYGGAPTYRASGFIYGIAANGSQPANDRLTGIKTKFLRAGGAQLDTPNGGYVNGKYADRWAVVKAYYSKAVASGSTLLILLHDLWGADSVQNVPSYPGDNGDWTQFTAFVAQVISDAQAAGMTGSNVRWELWNEPDLPNVFWSRSQTQWIQTFGHAFNQIRAALPNAIIEGPSLSAAPSTSNTWWTNFLDYVKANNVVPNIMSWHDEWGGNDPVPESNTLNGMLSSRGISVSGYDINEYGTNTEQNPGHSAWYIARLERANGGVDGLRGNWGMAGGLYEGMGDLVDASWNPLGQWWVYKRYAEMTGLRTAVSAGAQVDALAFQDSSASNLKILLGNKGGSTGLVSVSVTNIPSWLAATGKVNVMQEWIPSGSSALSAPYVVNNGAVIVSGGTITFPVNFTSALDAHFLTITPAMGGTSANFKISNRTTGLNLDGYGRTANGSDAAQYADSTSTNQQWVFEPSGALFKIRNVTTGLYLDGMGRITNPSLCGQYASSSNANQQWKMVSAGGGYLNFQNAGTGMFLDGLGYTVNGWAMGQYAGSGSTNQQFTLVQQ